MDDKRVTAEEIRDAHTELRKKTYQKAISLLDENQQAFFRFQRRPPRLSDYNKAF